MASPCISFDYSPTLLSNLIENKLLLEPLKKNLNKAKPKANANNKENKKPNQGSFTSPVIVEHTIQSQTSEPKERFEILLNSLAHYNLLFSLASSDPKRLEIIKRSIEYYIDPHGIILQEDKFEQSNETPNLVPKYASSLKFSLLSTKIPVFKKKVVFLAQSSKELEHIIKTLYETHKEPGYYIFYYNQTSLLIESCNDFLIVFPHCQILVCTIKAFLEILRHAFCKISDFSCIIMDDLSGAVKNHPYCLLMKEFYSPLKAHLLSKALNKLNDDEVNPRFEKKSKKFVSELKNWNSCLKACPRLVGFMLPIELPERSYHFCRTSEEVSTLRTTPGQDSTNQSPKFCPKGIIEIQKLANKIKTLQMVFHSKLISFSDKIDLHLNLGKLSGIESINPNTCDAFLELPIDFVDFSIRAARSETKQQPLQFKNSLKEINAEYLDQRSNFVYLLELILCPSLNANYLYHPTYVQLFSIYEKFLLKKYENFLFLEACYGTRASHLYLNRLAYQNKYFEVQMKLNSFLGLVQNLHPLSTSSSSFSESSSANRPGRVPLQPVTCKTKLLIESYIALSKENNAHFSKTLAGGLSVESLPYFTFIFVDKPCSSNFISQLLQSLTKRRSECSNDNIYSITKIEDWETLYSSTLKVLLDEIKSKNEPSLGANKKYTEDPPPMALSASQKSLRYLFKETSQPKDPRFAHDFMKITPLNPNPIFEVSNKRQHLGSSSQSASTRQVSSSSSSFKSYTFVFPYSFLIRFIHWQKEYLTALSSLLKEDAWKKLLQNYCFHALALDFPPNINFVFQVFSWIDNLNLNGGMSFLSRDESNQGSLSSSKIEKDKLTSKNTLGSSLVRLQVFCPSLVLGHAQNSEPDPYDETFIFDPKTGFDYEAFCKIKSFEFYNDYSQYKFYKVLQSYQSKKPSCKAWFKESPENIGSVLAFNNFYSWIENLLIIPYLQYKNSLCPARLMKNTGSFINLSGANELLVKFCYYLRSCNRGSSEGRPSSDLIVKSNTFESCEQEEKVVIYSGGIKSTNYFDSRTQLYFQYQTRHSELIGKTQTTEGFICKLYLPTFADPRYKFLSTKPIFGIVCANKLLAKTTACYQAILLLLENRLLDEHLLPSKSILKYFFQNNTESEGFSTGTRGSDLDFSDLELYEESSNYNFIEPSSSLSTLKSTHRTIISSSHQNYTSEDHFQQLYRIYHPREMGANVYINYDIKRVPYVFQASSHYIWRTLWSTMLRSNGGSEDNKSETSYYSSVDFSSLISKAQQKHKFYLYSIETRSLPLDSEESLEANKTNESSNEFLGSFSFFKKYTANSCSKVFTIETDIRHLDQSPFSFGIILPHALPSGLPPFRLFISKNVQTLAYISQVSGSKGLEIWLTEDELGLILQFQLHFFKLLVTKNNFLYTKDYFLSYFKKHVRKEPLNYSNGSPSIDSEQDFSSLFISFIQSLKDSGQAVEPKLFHIPPDKLTVYLIVPLIKISHSNRRRFLDENHPNIHSSLFINNNNSQNVFESSYHDKEWIYELFKRYCEAQSNKALNKTGINLISFDSKLVSQAWSIDWEFLKDAQSFNKPTLYEYLDGLTQYFVQMKEKEKYDTDFLFPQDSSDPLVFDSSLGSASDTTIQEDYNRQFRFNNLTDFLAFSCQRLLIFTSYTDVIYRIKKYCGHMNPNSKLYDRSIYGIGTNKSITFSEYVQVKYGLSVRHSTQALVEGKKLEEFPNLLKPGRTGFFTPRHHASDGHSNPYYNKINEYEKYIKKNMREIFKTPQSPPKHKSDSKKTNPQKINLAQVMGNASLVKDQKVFLPNSRRQVIDLDVKNENYSKITVTNAQGAFDGMLQNVSDNTSGTSEGEVSSESSPLFTSQNPILIPELTSVLPFTSYMFQLALLIPTLIYKISFYSLVDEFFQTTPQLSLISPKPPLNLCIQALTGPLAFDEIRENYERLEMLGDSYLKFNVSLDLFLKYKKANEGNLTARRMRLISNLHLFDLGYNFLKLHQISDLGGFQRKSWTSPNISFLFESFYNSLKEKIKLQTLLGHKVNSLSKFLHYPIRPIFDECFHWYSLTSYCEQVEKNLGLSVKPPHLNKSSLLDEGGALGEYSEDDSEQEEGELVKETTYKSPMEIENPTVDLTVSKDLSDEEQAIDYFKDIDDEGNNTHDKAKDPLILLKNLYKEPKYQGPQKYGSKCMADMVESLIGAYFIGSGEKVARRFLNYLGLVSDILVHYDYSPKQKEFLRQCLERNFGCKNDGPIPEFFSNAQQGLENGAKKPFDIESRGTLEKAQICAYFEDMFELTSGSIVQAPESESLMTSNGESRQIVYQIKTHDSNVVDLTAFYAQSVEDLPLFWLSPTFGDLEQTLGYTFKDRRLLLLAFTHSSLSVRYSYERLEFLGDAVLDWAITKYYYETFCDLTPGELTEVRSVAVCNESYSQLCIYYGFWKYIKCNASGIKKEIENYIRWLETQEESFSLSEENCGSSNIRHAAPKILGDVFESLAGAIFLDLDCHVEKFWKIYSPLLEWFLNKHAKPKANELNPMKNLIETVQGMGISRNELVINFTEINGADPNKVSTNFLCEIFLRNIKIAESPASTYTLSKRKCAMLAQNYLLEKGFAEFFS